jgi:DNA/RNA-binding domain of Phe-tRNA-synthetase-like protein
LNIMNTELRFADDERLKKVDLALIGLEGIDWERAAEVAPEALRDEVLQCARDAGAEAFGARIKAVRDMLRNGGYKPAGRAKPSSEYLLAAAFDGSFPRVNPFVDAVNLASLKYMYPISIFDADRAGRVLLCRLGAPGERYVFNGSGQEIDVEDLVCLCAVEPAFAAAESAAKGCAPDTAGSAAAGGRPLDSHTETSQPAPRPQGRPIVNPVRDSMATKLFEGARSAVIAVYAPGGPYGAEGRDLEAAARDLAEWCGRASESVAVRFASLS